MFADILFKLFPISFVIPYLLAIRTNRNISFQSLYLVERFLQFGNQAFSFRFSPLAFGDIAGDAEQDLLIYASFVF